MSDFELGGGGGQQEAVLLEISLCLGASHYDFENYKGPT